MAKLALINRDLKRARTVAKFAEKRAALKAVINDATRSIEERMEARQQLQLLPRDANPCRLRNRCGLTGRPRGTFRKFGLRSASSAWLVPRFVKPLCAAIFPALSRLAGKRGDYHEHE